MCERNLVAGTLVLALLLIPGFVGCQTTADYSTMNAKIDELGRNVKAMSDETREAAKIWVTQKQLDELQTRVVAGEHASYEQLAKLKADLAAVSEGASTAQIAGMKERLDKVEKDLKANMEVAMEHRAILGEVATKDLTGHWIPAIGDLTNNLQFTVSVDDAVRKAIRNATPPQWGTVRIDNRMLSWQKLEVNGTSHWVGPLSTLDVNVPVGSATTRLAGYEAAKIWSIEGPDYFQRVIIYDRQPLNTSLVRYP